MCQATENLESEGSLAVEWCVNEVSVAACFSPLEPLHWTCSLSFCKAPGNAKWKYCIKLKSILFSAADGKRSVQETHRWSFPFFLMPRENKSYLHGNLGKLRKGNNWVDISWSYNVSFRCPKKPHPWWKNEWKKWGRKQVMRSSLRLLNWVLPVEANGFYWNQRDSPQE